MSSYRTVLPMVFPYCLAVPVDIARSMIEALAEIGPMASARDDVPQGSSFAVTVDNWDGTWNLWMSAASLRYLARFWPELADLQPMPEPRPPASVW